MWIPRSTQDRLALLALIHGGPHMAFYEYCIVYPSYHNSPTYLYYHIIFYMWLVINIYSNLYYMHAVDITNRSRKETTRRDITQQCSVCEKPVPDRGHHCKFCDVCVLKRDHHCWFAATCVGHSNHRYYFWMIFYMWILSLYGNIFNLHHNALHLFGYSIWTVLSIPMPHVYFVLGYYSLHQLYIAIIMTIGVVLFCLISYLLYTQLVQIYLGQTQHERQKGYKQYNLGLKENIIEVFGEKWYITWLSPVIPSRLLGDGYVYRTSMEKIL